MTLGAAGRGGTVLLSSHLLAEVQATADQLVVIRVGQIVAQGAMTDLLTSTGLIVRAADHAGLRRLLTQCSVPFTISRGMPKWIWAASPARKIRSSLAVIAGAWSVPGELGLPSSRKGSRS